MASLKTTEQINLQLDSITVQASDVKSQGKKLGNGSYGTVFAVKYHGEVCAAKEIHSLLFEETEEKLKLLDIFNRECCQCSELVHPNIVKFIGIYFPHKQILPVMLMELMDISLRAYLEAPKTQVSLITKSSMLIDVAEGLSYLHHRNPSVIHRDLTPNNILLKLPSDKESLPVAKIADLGVAKAMETNSKIKQRLTKVPGTPGFMPPEAFDENPVYNTSLDMFSFGGVVLFVAIRVWPDPTAPNGLDRKTNKLVAFTEVQRRQQYLDKMIGETKIWRPMVEACLSNDPDERPKIDQVTERLRSFKLTELQLLVKELVNKLQQEQKSYSEWELERRFEEKWKEWMNRFTRNKEQVMEYPSDSEIEEEIIRILRQQLVGHDSMIVSKLVVKSLNERSCSLQLLIDKDLHLTSTRWMGFGSLGNDDVIIANQLTKDCLTSARNSLNTIKSQPFTSNSACQVLKSIFSSIDKAMSARNNSFKFKGEYKVDMAITVCTYASSVFKQATKEHRDNNPTFMLNEIKNEFLNMCKDLYKSLNRNTKAKVSDTTEQKVHKNRTDTIYMFIAVSLTLSIVFVLIAVYVI